MSHLILGTLNEEEAGMLLLSRLERLEEKAFEEVGMAILNAGCIITSNTGLHPKVLLCSPNF